MTMNWQRAETDLLSRQHRAKRLESMDGAARALLRTELITAGMSGRPIWAHGPMMRLALMDWSRTYGSLIACWLNGGKLPRFGTKEQA